MVRDVVFVVFQFLEPEEVCTVARVCMTWSNVAEMGEFPFVVSGGRL